MERSPQALLARWHRARSNAIADDLDRVTDRLALEAPAVSRLEWLSVARRRSPDDVPSLLASLPRADDPLLPSCLEALWSWPVDPRITTALHRLVLENLPRSDALAFWNRALPLIAWVGDVRAADWLADAMLEVNGPALATRALVLRANELITFLGLKPRDVAGPSIRASATPFGPAPSDANARLVFADTLLERGDARGELIHLQSLPAPRTDQRRRAQVLIRDYSRAWLGRLSAALKPQGLRFERGVVVAGRISGYRAVRTLFGAPEWETLESLDLRELHRRRPSGTLLTDFLASAPLRNVKRVESFPATELATLRASSNPTSITTLEVVGWAPQLTFEELVACPALRSLEVATLNGQALGRRSTDTVTRC
jgi:uncharacterized protein (TIGR02996 family)